MLCSKSSSRLGMVDADEECLSIACSKQQNPKREKAESNKTQNDRSAVKCRTDTENPMMNTKLAPDFGKRHNFHSNAL